MVGSLLRESCVDGRHLRGGRIVGGDRALFCGECRMRDRGKVFCMPLRVRRARDLLVGKLAHAD
ncbi:hypothetical protein WT24_27055 [Burkholderia sp. MSMB1078WGS]|nr:hypothetical protein WT24_27055 [Burkholderia sp. MSMB1078WGS]